MIKEMLISWIIKLVEILLVVILGYLIFIVVAPILGEAFAIAGVVLIFYFFGGIIRPYIKEIQNKITGNLKQDEETY